MMKMSIFHLLESPESFNKPKDHCGQQIKSDI